MGQFIGYRDTVTHQEITTEGCLQRISDLEKANAKLLEINERQGEMISEYEERIATLLTYEQKAELLTRKINEAYDHAASMEASCKELERQLADIKQQRQGDALDGQSTMEEAYSRIQQLEAQLKECVPWDLFSGECRHIWWDNQDAEYKCLDNHKEKCTIMNCPLKEPT